MKLITLEDVNNAILGTDIKVIDSIKITNLHDIDSIQDYSSGIYVITLIFDKSYIGYAEERIKGRITENLKINITWVKNFIRNSIKCIDIYLTENGHQADDLETILISKFSPELNSQYPSDVNDKFCLRYLKLCKKGDEIDSNYWKTQQKIYDEWKYRSANDKNWYELGPQARIEFEKRLKSNCENDEKEREKLVGELNRLIEKSGRYSENYQKDYLKWGMIRKNYYGRVNAIDIIYGINNIEDGLIYDDVLNNKDISLLQIKLRKKFKKLIIKAKEEIDN